MVACIPAIVNENSSGYAFRRFSVDYVLTRSKLHAEINRAVLDQERRSEKKKAQENVVCTVKRRVFLF